MRGGRTWCWRLLLMIGLTGPAWPQDNAPPAPPTQSDSRAPSGAPSPPEPARAGMSPLPIMVIDDPFEPTMAPTVDIAAIDPARPWSVGAQLYLVKPRFDANPAFVRAEDTGSTSLLVAEHAFQWRSEVGTRFWGAYRGPDAIGARLSHFYFDHRSQPRQTLLNVGDSNTGDTISLPDTLPTLPAGGASFGSPGVSLAAGRGQDRLTFASDLGILLVDGELTYDMPWRDAHFIWGAGVRYAHLNQGYAAMLLNSNSVLDEQQNYTLGQNFNGAGPLATMQFVSPVVYQTWGGEWRVLGAARLALLVGDAKHAVLATEFAPNAAGAGVSSRTIFQGTRDDTITISELEAGLEYGLDMPTRKAFLRILGVSHTYHGAGSATSDSGNFSLLGLMIALGMHY